MEKYTQLIKLYYHICWHYNNSLQYNVQRFSKNSNTGEITDEELVTIYLYCMCYEEKRTLTSMHNHIKRYWKSWFPQLPSYQTFVDRINQLSDVFLELTYIQMSLLFEQSTDISVILGDSFPIITCSAKRLGKVAQNITSKGYCATKKLHYFGVKLHALAIKRTLKLPLPNFIGISPASVHDLTAIKPILETFENATFVLDKAYVDKDLTEKMNEKNATLLTPIKEIKGLPDVLQKFNRAFNDTFNTAVSKIRQPIESLFNWLNEKTNLQNASKVRSENGLKVHVFGRISSALWLMF